MPYFSTLPFVKRVLNLRKKARKLQWNNKHSLWHQQINILPISFHLIHQIDLNCRNVNGENLRSDGETDFKKQHENLAFAFLFSNQSYSFANKTSANLET